MNKRKKGFKINFHKCTDDALIVINGHLFNMHNQPLAVNHLKNYYGFDKNLY